MKTIPTRTLLLGVIAQLQTIVLSLNKTHTTGLPFTTPKGFVRVTYEIDNTTIIPDPIAFELHEDGIIPDLLKKSPEHVLKIVYEEDVTVCFGNTLKAACAQNIPEKISWHMDYANITFHTIIFVDLDVTSRENPTEREWQHWVIGNIPDTRISAGQTLTEYIGPTPMHGNGTHRFVFLLYLQPQGKIHFEEMHLPKMAKDFKRAQFSSAEFAKKYKLGDPYAVNYFLCTWPEERDEDEEPLTPDPISKDVEDDKLGCKI